MPTAEAPSLLVYSRTAGWRHASIPNALSALRRLGRENGFSVICTEDRERIRPDFLKTFTAVCFLNTSGEVLDAKGRKALKAFVTKGGGFAGVHAACDTEYSWPWYRTLVGAWFLSHPKQQNAIVRMEDRAHPSTRGLPARWRRWDEWYNYRANPRPDVRVLATLDESTYKGGTMGKDHPIMWCHEHAGGRCWYTGLGHTKSVWSDAVFLKHMLGGLRWTLGLAK